jgi:hypothetical protein
VVVFVFLPLCSSLVSVRAAPLTFDAVFAPFVTTIGQDIAGAPISPVIARDGMRYQYTQYGRLEIAASGGGTAQLSPAGVILSSGRNFKPLQNSSVNADTLYFPQTQHSLAYGFRAFWDQHGGQAVLGLPISEEFPEVNPADNKQYTVQYFERAELVRHPESANTPKEIQLGPLGNELYQFFEGTRLPGGNDSTPVPGITTPGKPAFGIVTEFTNQPRNKLLGDLGDLGVGWVRQPLNWSAMEPSPGMYDTGGVDLLLNDLKVSGINVLLTISNSPSWATATGDHGSPRDPADFARFMGYIAGKFAGRVAAYEIWNEPNLALEWGPRVNAGQYVEMLKAVYPAIKAADPHALVVAAALGPTGVMDPTLGIDDVRYLEQLESYQNGAFRYFSDVQGTHPYGYRNPPDDLYPDKANTGDYTTHPSFYFRRIEQQRLAMIRWGDGNRAMWITEFGWGNGDFPEFAGVTPEMSAAWLTQAVQTIRTQYPWVGAMFLWNLNWSTFSPSNVSWGYFSLLNPDYSPRNPMYSTVKSLAK